MKAIIPLLTAALLAAGFHAGNQQGIAVGARGIYRRRVAGRTGAEDDQARVNRGRHVYSKIVLARAFQVSTGSECRWQAA